MVVGQQIFCSPSCRSIIVQTLIRTNRKRSIKSSLALFGRYSESRISFHLHVLRAKETFAVAITHPVPSGYFKKFYLNRPLFQPPEAMELNMGIRQFLGSF